MSPEAEKTLRGCGYAFGVLLAVVGAILVGAAAVWFALRSEPTAFKAPVVLTGGEQKIAFTADMDRDYGVFLLMDVPRDAGESGVFDCAPSKSEPGPGPGKSCPFLEQLEIRWTMTDKTSGGSAGWVPAKSRWYSTEGPSRISMALGGFTGQDGHRYVVNVGIRSKDPFFAKSKPTLEAYVPDPKLGLGLMVGGAFAFMAGGAGLIALLIGIPLVLLLRKRVPDAEEKPSTQLPGG